MKTTKALFGILTVTAVLALQVRAQAPITNGLVAYYPFNGNVNDASGNGNDGSLVGTNWAFSFDRFDGSTNSLYLNTNGPPPANSGGTYVIIPRAAALDFNQDFTLSAWVNIPDGLPAENLPNYWVHNLISNGTDDTSPNFSLWSAANAAGQDYLQFVCNNNGDGDLVDVHAFVPPKRGMWWQAVVVRSGSSMSLFRNGILVTNSVITSPMTNRPTLWIGSQEIACGSPLCPSSYPLVGGIDDVLIYNRALSTNEVQILYQAPPQILAQPLNEVGYWGFGAFLSVTADGTQPLSYQWLLDGFPISWATNATLIFTNLDLSDAGDYSVEVTNVYGNVLSESATLTVNPAGVSLGLYPGLTITGAIGKSFGIQYSTNLARTNGWATLSSLTLTQPAEFWFDTNANVSSGANLQRVYRVVAIP